MWETILDAILALGLAAIDVNGFYSSCPALQECDCNSLPDAVNEIKPEINSAYVFPNPSKNFVTLQFYLKSTTEISISIFDVLGKEVKNIPEKKFAAGKNSETISLENFSPGIYFLKMSSAKEYRVMKLVRE